MALEWAPWCGKPQPNGRERLGSRYSGPLLNFLLNLAGTKTIPCRGGPAIFRAFDFGPTLRRLTIAAGHPITVDNAAPAMGAAHIPVLWIRGQRGRSQRYGWK